MSTEGALARIGRKRPACQKRVYKIEQPVFFVAGTLTRTLRLRRCLKLLEFKETENSSTTMKRTQKRFDPATFLTHSGQGRSLMQMGKKQVIFGQGDPADSVFYIQKGKVRLSLLSKQGKEATLALMGPGDFVGEECIATAQPLRLTTATAISEGSVLRIEKASMVAALAKEHKLSDLFVAFLLARNARIQEDLADQLFNSSEKRLARVLLQLSQVGKSNVVESVVPKISQEMLAEMVGTTRARVNFFMNRFRKMGLIDYNGGIQVHPSLINIVLHE